MVYFGEYEHGWAYTKPQVFPFADKTYPEDPLGPDEISKEKQVLWPDTDSLTFHYPHPVTGKKVE